MTSTVTFPTAVGGDGSTVTDDSSATTGLANGGFRTRLVPMFAQIIAIANYLLGKADAAATSATNAAESEGSAAASEGAAADSAAAAGVSSATAGEWASQLGSKVAASDYSAKAYAVGTGANAPVAGSAKDWATKTGGTVDGVGFSAAYWAAQAAQYAEVAATGMMYQASSDPGAATFPVGAIDGAYAVFDGMGLYRYSATSTEIADGEVIVDTATGVGKWYQEVPHWNFVWTELAPLFDDLQSQANAALAKTINASVALALPNTSAASTTTTTTSISGATVGATVVVTAPAALPAQVIVTGYVAAAGVVTIRCTNTSSSTIAPASMAYQITVINP
jgi:hypothetical protein